MPTSYSSVFAGTPISWQYSGGDYTLSLASLANNAARQGPKSASLVHVTYGLPEYLDCLLESAVDVAVSQTSIECWFGESSSAVAGTDNPGNLSGTDAAWANPDELKLQLRWGGSLILSNARGANVQKQRFRFVPRLPHVIPAVVNLSGQALAMDDASHVLTVTPYYRRLSE